MSVPPSITIDHVQVAKIGKNMMTLPLAKIWVRKLSKQEYYWTLELEKILLIRIFPKTRRSRQEIWNIPSKFLM